MDSNLTASLLRGHQVLNMMGYASQLSFLRKQQLIVRLVHWIHLCATHCGKQKDLRVTVLSALLGIGHKLLGSWFAKTSHNARIDQ